MHVDRMTRCSTVGSAETVRRRLQEIARASGADDLILAAQVYDHGARLRSFEIAARNRGPHREVREQHESPRIYR